jgi:hypothetical protein
MGKGSKPRPTKKIKFDSNFDEINWKKPTVFSEFDRVDRIGNYVKTIKTKLGTAKRFVYK